MSGEGRGHATRACVVVEALRDRHEIALFASDCAYSLLAPRYQGSDVRVFRVPALTFAYSGPGRVDLFRTVRQAARFRLALGGYVDEVRPVLDRIKPDLVIADFEPVVPRAARAAGVPFVSFDHQHYLVVSELGGLPFALRQRARAAAPFVRALYDWQRAIIVSSFYTMPLRPAYRATTWVGTLIRPEIARLRPSRGSYVVAYIRRHTPPSTLAALAACGRPVRVYGLGERPPEGALRFLAVDEPRFIDDLAGCAAVVSTAGNQLVGEALYLGKPMLVMPEALNFEQAVNAHFLVHSGAGWAEQGPLTARRLGGFLEALPSLRARIAPEAVNGNQAAVAALERHIGGGGRVSAAVSPRPLDKRAARARPVLEIRL